MANKILQFGSYIFPAGLNVGSISAGGRVNTAEIPGRPGQYVGPRTIGEKSIRLEGVIHDADLRGAIDDLQAALALGKQQFYVEDDRYLWAVNKDLTHDYDPGSFQEYVNVQMTFVADPPFWESVTESNVQYDNPAAGSLTIVQAAGNVYAEPVIEIKFAGAGTANIGLGIGGSDFTLKGAVTANLVVKIDCQGKTVKTAAGADMMSLFDGSFSKLEPSATSLTYANTSGPALSYIKLTWRPRWY